ncbi:MAG TPA: acylphosphatase [Candidatus Limnocylindrales bacterium]
MSAQRTPPSARLEVAVHGRVQGVGYRVFAARAADRHGLTGWVANQRDGSVRAVAEGDDGELRAWLEELRKGPAGGYVDRVIEQWSPATGRFATFEIQSGWHAGD